MSFFLTFEEHFSLLLIPGTEVWGCKHSSAYLFHLAGWRCSARWSTPRSTTSFQPFRCCGGSVVSSGSPSSSAAQDSPRNTDAFAPAGTSAAARWHCAETAYNNGRHDGSTLWRLLPRCQRMSLSASNSLAASLRPDKGHSFVDRNRWTETSVKWDGLVYGPFPVSVTNRSWLHDAPLLSPSNHDMAVNFCACKEEAEKPKNV